MRLPVIAVAVLSCISCAPTNSVASTAKLLEHVDTPYSASYSNAGQAPVVFDGQRNLSLDGFRRVCVQVSGTSVTTSFDLFMGKLSNTTLSQRVADDQAADSRIHCYDVIGPEVALWLNGTPSATDQVRLWMYFIP